MSIPTQAPSATILTPGTPAPSAIWMWAEILFNALLASSGCISFAPPLPVLTFAQSVQLALQWAGDAQRAISKGKLAPPLRPVSLLCRLRPLHPFPQGSPHYRLAFINHVHLGPPTLPLLFPLTLQIRRKSNSDIKHEKIFVELEVLMGQLFHHTSKSEESHSALKAKLTDLAHSFCGTLLI